MVFFAGFRAGLRGSVEGDRVVVVCSSVLMVVFEGDGKGLEDWDGVVVGVGSPRLRLRDDVERDVLVAPSSAVFTSSGIPVSPCFSSFTVVLPFAKLLLLLSDRLVARAAMTLSVSLDIRDVFISSIDAYYASNIWLGSM